MVDFIINTSVYIFAVVMAILLAGIVIWCSEED
jgi:hypothetical protein